MFDDLKVSWRSYQRNVTYKVHVWLAEVRYYTPTVLRINLEQKDEAW